jgi:hypothetical protein
MGSTAAGGAMASPVVDVGAGGRVVDEEVVEVVSSSSLGWAPAGAGGAAEASTRVTAMAPVATIRCRRRTPMASHGSGPPPI